MDVVDNGDVDSEDGVDFLVLLFVVVVKIPFGVFGSSFDELHIDMFGDENVVELLFVSSDLFK